MFGEQPIFKLCGGCPARATGGCKTVCLPPRCFSRNLLVRLQETEHKLAPITATQLKASDQDQKGRQACLVHL